jgi:hypothetical protein
MRPKVRMALAEVAVLSRILEGLEQELIDATDEEILEAAKDLGMNPLMRGSAAFLGVKYPTRWQVSDFFAAQDASKRAVAELETKDPDKK